MAVPADPDQGAVNALRATAHPVRIRMLSILTNVEMSASDLARELDITTANASYHLRYLAKAGLVIEAGETQIRGGVAKLYTHPWEASVSSVGATPDDRASYVRSLADELLRRAAHRPETSRMYSADGEFWVSASVRARALELLTEASGLLHGGNHRPRTEGTQQVSLTVALFDMDSSPQARQ